MNEYIELINQSLEEYLPKSDDIVSEAMRYSVSIGGKRIRPQLVLEFCKICGGDVNDALAFACALEMIHTYSLIHDDLPCMDNDDFRRGKPSCHIKFGYEYALLAGDALLTLAFETVTKSNLSAEKIVDAVRVLSTAAGWAGMVGGQRIDLLNEGKKVSKDDLEQMDKLKTGELIRAACVLGCICAGRKDKISDAQEYAYCIGLSFQIVDDILDVTSDTQTLGKPVGSDNENEKSTYVSLLGIEKSEQIVSELTLRAKNCLERFDADTSSLSDFTQSLEKRKK